VQAFNDERRLIDLGLANYWGYNSIGFFAPDRATSRRRPNEFRQMVKALHAAGIEVILDVVYNHSCEGNHLGPRCRFKGIDNRSYYRLDRGPPALPRLHRHRQHAQRQPPGHAAAGDGQPALLGRGDARRRLPLRPRPGDRAQRHGAFDHRRPLLSAVARTRCSSASS
jgi:glycogen operon protein